MTIQRGTCSHFEMTTFIREKSHQKTKGVVLKLKRLMTCNIQNAVMNWGCILVKNKPVVRDTPATWGRLRMD